MTGAETNLKVEETETSEEENSLVSVPSTSKFLFPPQSQVKFQHGKKDMAFLRSALRVSLRVNSKQERSDTSWWLNIHSLCNFVLV